MACEDLWIEASDLRAVKVQCAPVDFGACTDDDLTSAIEYAQYLIQRITGKTFCTYDEEKTFDGSGKCKLFFHPVTCDQLNSVEEITYSCGGTTGEITSYVAYPHYINLCCCNSSGSDCCQTCGVWPVGCKNITIDGNWGEPVPPPLIKAVQILAIKELNPGALCGGCSTSTVSTRVRSIEWPDYKVQFEAEKAAEFYQGWSTGLPEVDIILNQYICTLGLFEYLP